MAELINKMQTASKAEAFKLFAAKFGYQPMCRTKAELIRKAKHLAERISDIEFQIRVK